jgi:hypothetical protein
MASGQTPLGGLKMERFPTWKIWRLLRTYPTRDIHLLLRVLRIKSYTSDLEIMHHAWTWVVLSFMVSLLISFGSSRLTIDTVFWLISLFLSFISFDSLPFAISAVSTISKWRKLANYDLFALLPNGELTSVLNLCRVHRAYLSGAIRGVKSLLIVIVLIAILLFLGFSDDAGSYEAGFGIVFLMLVVAVLLIGLLTFVIYLQSFVSATLIAMLASQYRNQREAQVSVIGGFLGMQLVLYGGLLPFLINLPFFGRQYELSSDRYDEMYLVWLIMFVPLIFIGCREVINFLLWQAVKRRLEA